MILTRRAALLAPALGMVAGLVASRPARAVIVRDSTWRAEGGRPGHEADGLRAHIALAHQPQFASLVSISGDPNEWGAASGTWIGNAGGSGWVLTAGHVFEKGDTADGTYIRRETGQVHEAARLFYHPNWNWSVENRTGYDFTIVQLKNEVTDAGPPPALYAGTAEIGKHVVVTGFGMRGIGSDGEKEKYRNNDGDKAAAEDVVDKAMDMVLPMPDDAECGNWIGVTFHEDGPKEGHKGGEGGTAPRLEGALGSGDSGGSTWLQSGGVWAIAGVNSSGTSDKYGADCYFGRVSGVREWIRSVVPAARFVGEGEVSGLEGAPYVGTVARRAR